MAIDKIRAEMNGKQPKMALEPVNKRYTDSIPVSGKWTE
ncbi:hypothetical protein SAMN04489841_1126 [Natrinema salaciae]|uniref:Uncharacterized protein n=1 Tax=Natrinema salaciae TaxID=1186196 RepID=A0A1H9CS20_9EURY|nr:hypothetical protein SAMN04489841_1126 [Natrinema salaciae]